MNQKIGKESLMCGGYASVSEKGDKSHMIGKKPRFISGAQGRGSDAHVAGADSGAADR